jgi:hypothetical protein
VAEDLVRLAAFLSRKGQTWGLQPRYGVFMARTCRRALVTRVTEIAEYPRLQRPLRPECRWRRTICIAKVPVEEKLYCPDCGHIRKRDLPAPSVLRRGSAFRELAVRPCAQAPPAVSSF